jgi:iron-sulfur cluster assembly accessory protein
MEPFILTDAAKEQMAKLLAKQTDKWAVRLSVLGGGCAGFKYDWGFFDSTEDVDPQDHVVEWPGGRFAVDSMSMLYIIGTTIDWREEVFGSQFEITNPSAKSGCGCGESFGV